VHVACEDVEIKGREREREGDVMRKHTCRKDRKRKRDRTGEKIKWRRYGARRL